VQNRLSAVALAAALAGCGAEDVANCASLRRSAPDKALEHCNRAVESRMVWSTEKARARLDRGRLHSDLENWSAAIADFTRAIDSGKLAPRVLVVAYYDRGSARLHKGELDAGIEDLAEAIRLDPLYADAYANLALARRMKGQLEQSLAEANAALKITPRHARAFLQRGATYLVQGDGGRALADLDEAIRLEPGLQAAWNVRGLLRRATRDWDRALADFDQAVKLGPRNAAALRNRASVLVLKRDFDAALRDLDASLKLDPRSTEALLRRAAIYGERGDTARMRADQGAAAALAGGAK